MGWGEKNKSKFGFYNPLCYNKRYGRTIDRKSSKVPKR
jgi:hypothetical protein